MALNWLWENKCGTLTERTKCKDGEYESNYVLYDGNALMIALSEWTEDGVLGKEEYWRMGDFWLDEKHMENCMEDNAYRFKSIRLNTKMIAKSKLNKIVKACIKYGVEITLYAEEKGAEK